MTAEQFKEIKETLLTLQLLNMFQLVWLFIILVK